MKQSLHRALEHRGDRLLVVDAPYGLGEHRSQSHLAEVLKSGELRRGRDGVGHDHLVDDGL